MKTFVDSTPGSFTDQYVSGSSVWACWESRDCDYTVNVYQYNGEKYTLIKSYSDSDDEIQGTSFSCTLIPGSYHITLTESANRYSAESDYWEFTISDWTKAPDIEIKQTAANKATVTITGGTDLYYV